MNLLLSSGSPYVKKTIFVLTKTHFCDQQKLSLIFVQLCWECRISFTLGSNNQTTIFCIFIESVYYSQLPLYSSIQSLTTNKLSAFHDDVLPTEIKRVCLYRIPEWHLRRCHTNIVMKWSWEKECAANEFLTSEVVLRKVHAWAFWEPLI